MERDLVRSPSRGLASSEGRMPPTGQPAGSDGHRTARGGKLTHPGTLLLAAGLGALLLGGLGFARAELSAPAPSVNASSSPLTAGALSAKAPAPESGLAPMPVVSRSNSAVTAGTGLTWFLLCLALFLAINGVALVRVAYRRAGPAQGILPLPIRRGSGRWRNFRIHSFRSSR